jgi:mannose-6-phosphate isomerase-like protein (cupin superfamily)
MSAQVDYTPAPGDMFLVMADVVTFRVPSAASDGRVMVGEIAVPVGGGPPPLHVHVPDEVFHVIEGEVTVFTGDPEDARPTLLHAGETKHVPGGVPHTFRNFGDKPARVLLTFSPGEMMERFFITVGHRVTDPCVLPVLDLEAEVPRVFEIGRDLGMRTLSPPRSLD